MSLFGFVMEVFFCLSFLILLIICVLVVCYYFEAAALFYVQNMLVYSLCILASPPACDYMQPKYGMLLVNSVRLLILHQH